MNIIIKDISTISENKFDSGYFFHLFYNFYFFIILKKGQNNNNKFYQINFYEGALFFK